MKREIIMSHMPIIISVVISLLVGLKIYQEFSYTVRKKIVILAPPFQNLLVEVENIREGGVRVNFQQFYKLVKKYQKPVFYSHKRDEFSFVQKYMLSVEGAMVVYEKKYKFSFKGQAIPLKEVGENYLIFSARENGLAAAFFLSFLTALAVRFIIWLISIL